MITLDTDVVSELMRPRPSRRLVTKLAEVPPAEQSTTSITIGELAYGAQRVGRQDLYERAVSLLAGVTVFDFDRDAAEHYGRARVQLEREGRRLADPDLRIAAIAVSNGLALITGNLAHFHRVPGLDAEDWIRSG